MIATVMAGGEVANAAPATTAASVEGVVVVGVSPLPGSGVDIDKTPADTQTLGVADLGREGTASVISALANQLSSVTLNDNLDDAFQPDVLVRGFEASPVLGTPQGVAVYQNGARINEAFGDTVNWDLIPDLAIRRLDVMGSNPVFGLNALGGALVLAMKSGFTDPGGDAFLSGGSFGRRDASAEWGGSSGAVGLYLAARGVDEDGWRVASSDSLRQAYGDLTVRGRALSLDLSVTAADNHLHGESAAPVQELAVGRDLIFTNPQANDDRLAFVTLGVSYAVTPTLSLQAAAYYRGFWQSVVNGNTTSDTACGEGPSLGSLCQSDGLTPLTTASGGMIPDISMAGSIPIGELDDEKINSSGGGGSVQATSTADLLGRQNHLTLGASLDSAVTGFSSNTQVGAINTALTILPSGFFVNTVEASAFNATPVSLRASTTYEGLYATDTFNATRRLAVTISARANAARVDLADRLGTDLDGRNRYHRINPAVGGAYKVSDRLTVYVGYSEGSRTPNASEIECSNPLRPCLLPSSLASDPPTLRQVVSHTWEAGARGRTGLAAGVLTWHAGAFVTDVRDDIYGVATSLGAGYFQNIAGTRRDGLDLDVRYRVRGFDAYASYSHIDATFRSAFALPSPSNPFQDAGGNIHVVAGDHLPGVPRDRLKFGADVEIRQGWSLGAAVSLVGDQVYHGDESNQLAPLPGYTVVSLHGQVDLTSRLSMFATIDNLMDARYATYGVLGDPTGVNAPGVPPGGSTVNPRFQSPSAPRAVFGGLKVRF